MKAIVACDFALLDHLEYTDWPDPETGGEGTYPRAETVKALDRLLGPRGAGKLILMP